MSIDDLYNNFKIVKQEVKRTVTTSSSSGSQNMAFISTPGSTNEDNIANVQVNNQPHGSHLMHEDLEQIHEDDLEEIYLKWQLALLSVRARKYYQRTGKKITINGSDTTGYDKSKSFMADEEVPTKMALMAFSDLDVHNDKTCSNSCLKNYEILKTQYDNLRIEFNKSEFDLATYKRGVAFVEEQLIFYKKNEVVFRNQIAVLKIDASIKDSEINALKIQIEKLKKEKESNQIKIDNFENASKSLDKLIGSQISDNNRKGMEFNSYNVVAPPPTGLFAPPSIDLSSSGLKEFQHPEFEGYGVKVNKSSEVMVSEKFTHKPKQADQPRKVSQNPRNNKTNWNEKKSKKLGVGF
ncbi:hypothetical protein Tco_1381464 [Tanacetum coccineum]